MNIFLLNEDLDLNMQQMVDRHVVKMILEATQLLSSVYYFTNEEYLATYKLSHGNHPCAIWARKSIQNWKWLRDYGLKLCKEYTYRYGKIHKCQYVIDDFFSPTLPDIGLTQLPKCMPDKYKVDSVIESYRAYYIGEKSHLFEWKNREIPNWIKKVVDNEN